MKLKLLLIVALLAFQVAVICYAAEEAACKEDACAIAEAGHLEYIRTIQLTSSQDGYGARPEIVSDGNYFYVVYLGDINSNRKFKIKILNKGLRLVNEKSLIRTMPLYGSPTDIRVSKDKNFLYAFYELSSPRKGAYLFSTKYKLDRDFTEIITSDGPIAEGKYFFNARDSDETLNDPASVIVDNKIYLVTQIRHRKGGILSAKTLYRVRELSPSLRILSSKDLDISDVMVGWSGASSLFYNDNRIYHIQASISGAADLKMIRFDKNWNYSKNDVFNLTNTDTTTETMPIGCRYTDNLLFLSYRVGKVTKVTRGRPLGSGQIWLEVFDSDFKSLDKARVSPEGLKGEHSTVEVVGSFVYVAYDAKTLSEKYSNIYVNIFKFR